MAKGGKYIQVQVGFEVEISVQKKNSNFFDFVVVLVNDI